MYMRYTHGQNEEYSLSMQECVLNLVLTIRVGFNFMYMRYTQEQNEEYLLSRSVY